MICSKCKCYVPELSKECPSCGRPINRKKRDDYSVTIKINGEEVEAYLCSLSISYDVVPHGVIRKFEMAAIEYEPKKTEERCQ